MRSGKFQTSVRKGLGVRIAGSHVKRRLTEALGDSLASGARARSKLNDCSQGITVITVNWNTLPFLKVLIRAVQSHAPEGTRLLVVDNASADGSREYLRSQRDVDSVLLPLNIGHGRALDIGVARARTDTVVLLDVDAFPISSDWLDRPLAALESGMKVSGAHMHRNFIHPCFLVTRRDLVMRARTGFAPVGRVASGRRFDLAMDVGEAFSQAIILKFGDTTLDKIPATERMGDGERQVVFGDAVFHNFFSTYGPYRVDALERFHSAVERFGV